MSFDRFRREVVLYEETTVTILSDDDIGGCVLFRIELTGKHAYTNTHLRLTTDQAEQLSQGLEEAVDAVFEAKKEARERDETNKGNQSTNGGA